MKIGKKFRFEAAHQLPGHTGKCQFLHGHTYTVEVVVEGPVREVPQPPDNTVVPSDAGMVIDFGIVGAAMKEIMDTYLDHKFLNESIHVPRTTAEYISAWIFGELCVRLTIGQVSVASVQVQEGEGGWVICNYGDWMALNKPCQYSSRRLFESRPREPYIYEST